MADFFERAEPMFSLYEQGKYIDALHLAEELAREFPDRSIDTSYWRTCLLTISGQKERGLKVMAEAVNKGLWWAPERLRQELDLKELQGNPEFERLVSVCAQRHDTAQGSSKPQLLILEPGPSTQTSYPLLMVFHGRDDLADREKHHWKSAGDLGWLVALAQSSQVGSLASYVWDDSNLAYREIRQHFDALQKKYTLDRSRIVLGGFSQGSAIALLSALRGDIPATAFIAVAPGRMANVDDLPALAESAGGRGHHGVIVAGGKDPRFEIFTQISETLSAHGIPCQLESRPDLGHAYPSDFKELLEKTISSISHKEHE